MEKLNGYKQRFFQLMESTMGDVKPLINEQVPPRQSGQQTNQQPSAQQPRQTNPAQSNQQTQPPPSDIERADAMADKAISQIPGLIYKKGGESYSFAKDRYGNYYSGNKNQNERIIYNKDSGTLYYNRAGIGQPVTINKKILDKEGKLLPGAEQIIKDFQNQVVQYSKQYTHSSITTEPADFNAVLQTDREQQNSR